MLAVCRTLHMDVVGLPLRRFSVVFPAIPDLSYPVLNQAFSPSSLPASFVCYSISCISQFISSA